MEYSAKYRVSLSTLRRRIKAGEIEHKLIEGKYLLKNGPPQTGSAGLETIAPPQPMSSQTQSPTKKASAAAAADKPQSPDQFWQTTQGLLNEIKKAYSLILQEKEEQILQLKEEVADLKTLVRVLEDDNSRLKNSQPGLNLDLDLDLGLEA
jgi:hypothetical protein